MSELDPGDQDLVPTLLRWQEFGGVWRLLSQTPSGASVALCRCDGGEEVERLSTSHPATLEFLATHSGTTT
jgi:hypothetical protein